MLFLNLFFAVVLGLEIGFDRSQQSEHQSFATCIGEGYLISFLDPASRWSKNKIDKSTWCPNMVQHWCIRERQLNMSRSQFLGTLVVPAVVITTRATPIFAPVNLTLRAGSSGAGSASNLDVFGSAAFTGPDNGFQSCAQLAVPVFQAPTQISNGSRF